MARVPYDGAEGLARQPISVPEDYEDIRAPATAFGSAVAEGTEKLGQGGLDVDKFYSQVAAKQAVNNFQLESHKLLFGDPNVPGDVGFYGLKGQGAMDAQQPTWEKLQQLQQDGLAQLPNPAAQSTFLDETRFLLNRTETEMGFHYSQEANAWAQQTDKTSSDLALLRLRQNPNDPQTLQEANTSLLGANIREAQRLSGGKPTNDMMEDAKLRTRADIAEARIEALIGLPNGAGLAQAKQVFDGPDAALLRGPRYDALASKLRAHSDASLGDSIFNSAASGATPQGATNAPSDLRAYGQQVAEQHGVPWELFQHQIAGESNWDPNVAASSAGARGIAQFMPGTATQYGVDVGDAKSSLAGAARYMADLHQQSGSWSAALTGYLTGMPGAPVKSVIASNPEYREAYRVAAQLDAGQNPGSNAPQSEGPAPTAQPPALTTPISQPPGMAALAQAELQAVQHYERTVSAIEADPRGADNPAATQRARERAEQELRSRILDISAHRQILTENQNAALDGYMKQLEPGKPLPPGLTDQIAADQNLGPENRKNLYGVIQAREKSSVEQSAATNGPGYFDVRRRMLLPADSPDKISDPSQLIALGVPDQQGNVWLTDSGIRNLTSEMSSLKTDPGYRPFAVRRADLEKAVKGMIDKSNPLGGQLDPVGGAQFYNWQSLLDQRIAEYREQGKSPLDLLDPTKSDFMGSPKVLSQFQTTMQQGVRQRANAISQPPQWPSMPGQSPETLPPGAVTPRQPGESISDYMSRTGMGLPAMPAAPGAPAAPLETQ